MKNDSKDSESKPVRVELKYCEHCGGLWVRERGAGVVYCDHCLSKVADLPIPKTPAGRLILPVRPHTVVEDYEVEVDDDEKTDFETAAGGAA